MQWHSDTYTTNFSYTTSSFVVARLLLFDILCISTWTSNTIFSNIYPENIYRDEIADLLKPLLHQAAAGRSTEPSHWWAVLHFGPPRAQGGGQQEAHCGQVCGHLCTVLSRKLLLLAAGCTGRGSGQSADYWTVHPSVWWVGPITLQPFPPQLSFAFKMFDQFVLKPDIWMILALLYQLSLCLMQPPWEKLQ